MKVLAFWRDDMENAISCQYHLSKDILPFFGYFSTQ
jgi:hypothetical protein